MVNAAVKREQLRRGGNKDTKTEVAGLDSRTERLDAI